MAELFKLYRWPLLGGLAGLTLGLLFLTLGFFKTLLVLALTLGGILGGCYLAKATWLKRWFK